MEKNNQQKRSFSHDFPIVIKPTVGEIKIKKGYFCVPIEVRALKGKFPHISKEVRIKKGTEEIHKSLTDQDGEVVYIHKEPLKFAGERISLRVLVADSLNEASIPVMLPEAEITESSVSQPISHPEPVQSQTTPKSDDPEKKEPEAEKPKVEDPENFDFNVCYGDDGKYTLFARVTKTGGVGISVPVTIYVCGEAIKLTTDEQGNASISPDETLETDKIYQVRATVSGIRDAAKLTLKRPKIRVPAKSRTSLEWLLFKNNGRAVLFLVMAVILWFRCFTIGWGDPILNPPATELSVQQQMYNDIAAGVNTALAIQPEKSAGNWQKYFWLFSFAWTIWAMIYAPLSLREEIAEGFRNGVDKIIDKFRQTSNTASDPLIDKLIAWSNTYARVKKQSAVTPTATVVISGAEAAAATEAPKARALTFWDVFKSDMISEILLDLVPTIFKAVFKK